MEDITFKIDAPKDCNFSGITKKVLAAKKKARREIQREYILADRKEP